MFQNFILKVERTNGVLWCRFDMGLNGKTEGVPKDIQRYSLKNIA